MSSRSSIGYAGPFASLWLIGLSLVLSSPVHSQIVVESDQAQLTVEGFANVTVASVGTANDLQSEDAGRIDGGLRVLGRTSLAQGPMLGIRLAVEGSDENTRLTEASILLFDHHGRIEVGERMG